MDDKLIGDLIYVLAFALGGLVFAVGPFAVVHLLMTRKTRQTAQKTDHRGHAEPVNSTSLTQQVAIEAGVVLSV